MIRGRAPRGNPGRVFQGRRGKYLRFRKLVRGRFEWHIASRRMLPRKRIETGDGDGARGGFEVRVIGDRRTSAPAQSDGRGLEIGLRIGSERMAAEPSGIPVHRLGARDEVEPLQAKPMSEVGPAEPRVSRRGRKARMGLKHWTLWMSVATCVLVVAAVAGLLIVGKGQSSNARDREPGYVFEKVQQLDREEEFFLINAGELIEESETLLEGYAAATSVEQVLPMVRDAARVKERMARLWQPWGPGPMLAAGEGIEGTVSDEAARPVICLKGRRGDFTPFEMVFVRDGERMKLDWEASHGIGEVQVAELQQGASAGGKVVRGLILPSQFYSLDYPDTDFRSFRMGDAGGEHFIWVFARLGSEVAKTLEHEFNEGAVLLEKSGEIRATVRLTGSGGGNGKCHEITEMLHKGWVTP